MKKLQITFVALLALASAHLSEAAFLASYATVNGTYYDLNAATVNPDFQSADLGSFDPSSSQLLLGAEMNINGGNVQFSNVGWAVFDNTNTIIGSFVETGGSFDSAPSGNDRWLLAGGSRPDILTSLGNGDYTLQVYLHGNYNGGGDNNFYESNGGSNFKASFKVVPEPGTLSLALIGALGLLGLRRRRA